MIQKGKKWREIQHRVRKAKCKNSNDVSQHVIARNVEHFIISGAKIKRNVKGFSEITDVSLFSGPRAGLHLKPDN